MTREELRAHRRDRRLRRRQPRSSPKSSTGSITAATPKQCSVYTIPTGTIGTLASEISMRFGFRGLSHIVSTGCTSSTDAIGYAYRNIQAGVLDTIVAGGVDAPIAPLIMRGFMLCGS